MAAVNSYNPSSDVNSEYYVHSNDMNNSSLVNPPLGGENFHTWKRAMQIFIGMMNKTGFIDGTLPCPSDTGLHAIWNRCNLIVISWILNSVTPEIAQSILYLDNASNIWTVLEERYEKSNEPRVFELCQSLHTLQQGNMSLREYFTKKENIWLSLNTMSPMPECTCSVLNQCACELMEKLRYRENSKFRREFLIGLDSSYSAVRGVILMMKPITSINETYQMIVQEEAQRSMAASHGSRCTLPKKQ